MTEVDQEAAAAAEAVAQAAVAAAAVQGSRAGGKRGAPSRRALTRLQSLSLDEQLDEYYGQVRFPSCQPTPASKPRCLFPEQLGSMVQPALGVCCTQPCHQLPAPSRLHCPTNTAWPLPTCAPLAQLIDRASLAVLASGYALTCILMCACGPAPVLACHTARGCGRCLAPASSRSCTVAAPADGTAHPSLYHCCSPCSFTLQSGYIDLFGSG